LRIDGRTESKVTRPHAPHFAKQGVSSELLEIIQNDLPAVAGIVAGPMLPGGLQKQHDSTSIAFMG
jgi:hypothetical protein